MDVIAAKGIKVIVDGGALGPQNLAKRCQELSDKENYGLKVAYVSGDNITQRVRDSVRSGKLPDSWKSLTNKDHRDATFTADEVLACTAYIGARAIVKGLENGADIVCCGRVADASPIIGAAWVSS